MTAANQTQCTPTGQACCEGISSTMIGHFTTRLEVEAGKAGGSLSAEAIRHLAEQFIAQEYTRFVPVFQRSAEECNKARDALQWEAARRRPFDRILMKKFAHLFPPRTGDDGGRGVLSRRMIPGFNLTVDKMIGPTLYEQCQRKSQAVLDRYRLPGGNFDWDRIYADPEANSLANDVLVVVAHYFANFAHRRTWFLSIVNSHLARASDKNSDDARWQLTDYGFAELMGALFSDLQASMVANAAGVKKRYGDHTFEALKEFFGRLKEG